MTNTHFFVLYKFIKTNYNKSIDREHHQEYEKYKKLYEAKKIKNRNRPVYNFVFGNVLGKKSVFLIQNIFPTKEIYIENKYVNSNKDVEIPTSVKDKVIVTSLRVVELAERGINVPFYDIVEMKKILLEN